MQVKEIQIPATRYGFTYTDSAGQRVAHATIYTTAQAAHDGACAVGKAQPTTPINAKFFEITFGKED